ncbi:leucine-rich repeat-containing protein 31 isoform X1 [Lampris incognitus]|uniref:leucine-rich repeat-containing protein 31 isoform X1 n=1 Tax=Lampris incognitus TaxID=2546036 RepID=UPI0024B48B18|nr:leucine-rich repeat-containing protein 31 isoform X1 [Lampris incognitus]
MSFCVQTLTPRDFPPHTAAAEAAAAAAVCAGLQMESADGQRGRDTSQRRSPLDLIMNQIRRKRTAADRKPSVLSCTSDRGGIPEDTEDREGRGEGPAVADSVQTERDLAWGRVCVFLHQLGKTADHRSLKLAHCDLTATDLLELATLLCCLPQLEEMDLSWNELIGGSLPSLTTHIQHVGRIRTLKLCSCRLNADDITALGEALECVPFLEMLDLSWNVGVGGGALRGLLDKLHPQLRELHLVACQLISTDAAILGAAVSALPRLCVLDVSCNPLLAEESNEEASGGIRRLALSLSHIASLATLRLQACGLTSHSLDALGGLFRCLPAMRELDLSCNKGLSGGLSHLTSHLSHLTHLESLDLHLCCLTHSDLESLVQVLPSLPELTDADLSANREVGAMVHSLVSTLPLPQMRHLPLSACSLTQESFTALALAVPFLKSVDVSWCKVVGGRLALLLDALQPSVIRELRLSSCQLTTDDLRHLALVCKRGCLSSLRLLDLSYNSRVGDEGWAGLFGAGGGLGSLEEVDVSLRPASSAPATAWMPSLLAALPNLPALARLAMQRWTLTSQARDRLGHALKKRHVQLEWDPPTKDATSSYSPANQDRAEELHSEE